MKPARWSLVAIVIVLGSACPWLWATRPAAQEQMRMGDTSQAVQDVVIRNLEDRVSRIEAIHPDALSEAVKAQTRAMESQQNLMYGIMAGLVVNFLSTFALGRNRGSR